MGYTLVYLTIIVLIPLTAVGPRPDDGLGCLLGRGQQSARGGLLSAQLRRLAAGGGDQRRLRPDLRLGSGALPLSRQGPDRFAGRSAVRLPTAVAGIALATIYSENGPVGKLLEPWGIEIAYTPKGVLLALVFIGLPFVVRTVQPVLADLEKEVEEAAAGLGASRWQTFCKIILPHIAPALLTGFAMAFARAVGEYGSVIFIAGNVPMVSEITPLMIITKLEQYDYAGATAVASVMLIISFVLLLIINGLQGWMQNRYAKGA
jgi:sulfate transport system permease protein